MLEEPVDLLHVPTWPAPAKIMVDPPSFGEELRTIGRHIASYLPEYGPPGGRMELWDLACVAAPEAVTVVPLAVPTLDAAGAHDFTQTGRKVDIVSDLDERRILAALMEALARHPAGERT